MKKNILLFMLGLTMISLCFSCSKDNEDSIPPKPVTGVTVTPDYGALIFQWKNPTDKDLYYVDIAFIDSKGKQRSVKSSSYADSTTIDGFANNKTYSFKMTAYDRIGNASTPVVVSAAPKVPVYILMLDSIKITPDFGGARIEWKNNTGKPFNINVSYKDNSGALANSFFSSVAGANTVFISGLDNTKRDFILTTSDNKSNTSAPQTISLVPLKETKISKAGWSILDFDSQEPADHPNGGDPSFLIDDDLNTYWSTAWLNTQPGYPHHITVNMGQQVTVSRVVLATRQNDIRGATKVQFLGSTDGVNWTDFGTFPFQPINAGQSFRISSNPKVQYIRVVAVEGSYFFTFFAELDVYGQQ